MKLLSFGRPVMLTNVFLARVSFLRLVNIDSCSFGLQLRSSSRAFPTTSAFVVDEPVPSLVSC